MGSALNAVQQVLAEAGEPLHYKEITRRVLTATFGKPTARRPRLRSAHS